MRMVSELAEESLRLGDMARPRCFDLTKAHRNGLGRQTHKWGITVARRGARSSICTCMDRRAVGRTSSSTKRDSCCSSWADAEWMVIQ
ncbi:hypothetical protein SCP_0104930 [Sparassis crispa]|uniref:Uncharacterized protein n=1 Tax=Sparassis crispa TaxID=139825 RepID=A0A401G624_9APHY|nr:hypothetical protein SCP_0104930 [Sparassis crispa]GBE77613.1 hypothetical protein SCP_0104930 [Sparassis crispa]